MKYLFDAWAAVDKRLSGATRMLFLDFDGTLCPLAPTPAEARLSQGTTSLLRALTRNAQVRVAIVSGRALADLRKKVGLRNIVYAGNHGMEVSGPLGSFTMRVSPAHTASMVRIKHALAKRLAGLRGVILEDKRLSLTVHYRRLQKASVPVLKRIFRQVVAPYAARNRCVIKAGKMALEVRVPAAWDKGKVVQWLLKRQRRAAGTGKIVAVYIGDDETDEDAFLALEKTGITVSVGKNRNTNADYYLRDTRGVVRFLKEVHRIGEEAEDGSGTSS